MNWSFVFLAQHEDPEVGSMLLESTIQNIEMKTWSEKFPECGNGKRRDKKVRVEATFAQLHAIPSPHNSGGIRPHC
jgi:hypothetical protein